jgi:hypothetical protein
MHSDEIIAMLTLDQKAYRNKKNVRRKNKPNRKTSSYF